MQLAVSDRSIRIFRVLSIVLLSASALFFVCKSIHWRWQWDTSCLHYVSFLIDQGKAPYRDIVDMNMPGAFFMEGWAISIFGGGDLGWRLYEFCLLTILTASMIVIAKPQDWLAGLYAGVLFVVVHGAEGLKTAVQREEIMCVMLMAAMAFGFVALRRRQPWLMFPFGLLIWLPVSLKPTVAPMGLILLLLAVWQLRRRHEAGSRYLVYAAAGMIFASAIIVGFLVRYHVTRDFLEILGRLLPYYATQSSATIPHMISELLPRKLMYPILFAALLLSWKNKGWRGDWERQALVLATSFGALSFIAQRKGFLYHRYPLLSFLFLWICLEFTRALKQRGWTQFVGLAGLSAFLLFLPAYCKTIAEIPSGTPTADMLVADLEKLGTTQQLQGQVQCLDMVNGCFTALYRLGLVQSTGFVSDFMLFGPRGSIPSPFYRAEFFREIIQKPPRIIVVTTAWRGELDSFDKLEQWPQFLALLETNYTLMQTRTVLRPENPDDPHAEAYRIYTLKQPSAILRPQ